MNTETSLTAIEKFRQLFATHGWPEMMVTDNGGVKKMANELE